MMRSHLFLSIYLLAGAGCSTPSPPAPSPRSPKLDSAAELVRAHEVVEARVSRAYEVAKAQSPSQRLGPLWVLPTYNEVWHVHGGEAAWVYSLSWAVQSDADHVVVVEVVSLELLSGHCVQPGWFSRAPLALTKVEWSAHQGAGAAKLEGHKHSLAAEQAVYGAISFKPVSVYNACERFAYGLNLVIDGAAHTLEVPLSVVREEPYDETL